MMMLADDPMAVLALVHDVILTRIEATEDGSRRRAFYICESCCCMFWPDENGGPGVIYPDRYTHVGIEGTHCDEEEKCGCHNFPYCTLDELSDDATWTLAWEDDNES